LSLGGEGSHIRIAGYSGQVPLAVLGFERGDLFIQPTNGDGTVICNGTPVSASQWLRSGDVLRLGQSEISISQTENGFYLTIETRAAERKTDPPQIQPHQATDEIAGEQPDTRIRPVDFQPASSQRVSGRRRRPTLGRVMVFGCLILLGLVAWFLFTARAVEITSEPVADVLDIEGTWLKIELGGRFLLRPGEYRVRLEKQGYLPLEERLVVNREASQSHGYRLEKMPGLLRIEARPVGDAEVRIDGEVVGATPMEPIALKEGDHLVEILHPMYVAYSTTVSMEGAGSILDLSVELTPNWAAIEFNTRPAGATIRIDGQSVGTTPVITEVTAGNRQIEVRLDGYKPYRSQLLVQANVPKSLPSIVLQPSDGLLVVSSQPEEATVSIDGEYAGLTPLDLELKPGRSYDVSLSKLGFENSNRTVEIVSGRTSDLIVELVPRYGEIEIDGRPADADLFVDGEAQGKASQVLRLQAVPHEIVVQKEGFESFRQTITPRPGFPQQIQVTLRTPEEVRRAATPARLRNSLGQEMVLIEPGTFRMGASRREPGRRANETLRDVQLTRSFYIGAREISNREFKKFRESHRSGRAGSPTLERDDHPVVAVNWDDAVRFCNWLSEQDSLPKAYVQEEGTFVLTQPLNTGYRLPTEAEWAWAARFAGRDRALKFPWGESLPVPADSGNYGDLSAAGMLQKTLPGYNDRYPATSPVESFNSNAVGLKNMGGNVAEWTNDFYSIPPPTTGEPSVDPMGPSEGEYRVIRGSSWMDSTITELRLSYRDYGNRARPDVGFRIARFAE
jgi:formylglycine-generating enzyme required for sulfatase activity